MQLQVSLKELFSTAIVFALSMVLGNYAFAAPHRKVLHIFANRPAANPGSNLILDASGNIYGTTATGGIKGCATGCGTVFQLSPQAGGGWSYRVIYKFQGKDDGGYPVGTIVFDTAGRLYGATGYGYGGVFQLTRQSDNTWTETTIHTFTASSDGATPYAGVSIDGAGNVYGTTHFGGAAGAGTVYQLTPVSGGGWSENVLYSFSGNDGAEPSAGVFIDPVGNLYGTTTTGGSLGGGTVFELNPKAGGGWTETVLYSFNPTGDYYPEAGVLLDSSGSIYGTTANDPGSVFRLTRNSDGTWTNTTLHVFGGQGDGVEPRSDLVMDTAGNLWGTTYAGGNYGYGAILELTPETGGKWKESVFFTLDLFHGASPIAPVVFDAAGDLFLATYLGGRKKGVYGHGSVLEIIP